ncbi:MAG TPA: methyl-accepting chemotaxis protein, partial [Hyphomicrobiales bacterium]|nr:methyl-accepting chemotaxis protein [Hyphomicrobiales bacterium]
MSFNSMTIRSRLYLIGGVVISGFLVLAGIGWYEGEKVKTAMDEAAKLRAEIAEISRMRLAGVELVLAAMDSIIDRDEGAIQPERQMIITSAIGTIRNGIPAAQATAEMTGKTGLLGSFDADFAELVQAVQVDLKTLIESRASMEEFAALDDAIDGGGERAMASLAELADAGGAALQARLEEAQAAAAESETIQLAMTFVLLVVLGGLIVVLGQSISGALARVTGCMKRLAGGNLDIDTSLAGRRDEIGAMATALLVFRDNALERQRLEEETRDLEGARARRQAALEHLIDGFRTRVEDMLASVGAHTGQMRATAEALGDIAASASGEAHSVAAVSGETSDNVQTVAAAAEELSASISEIGNQITKTASFVGHARESAKTTSVKVAGLAAAGEKIGDVVSLIQDIAEQTNLLA